MKELREGSKALKGMGTPQEDQQSQLTWLFGLSDTEPPSKEYKGAGAKPTNTYGVDV